MALSSGHLVTSIISPRAGKGDPDCSKTKLTFRPHRREYFPAFYASRCARVIHSWIPEGVAGRWVLSLNNLGLPSLHRDLLYSSPGAPSSAPFWTVQLVILTVTSRHFSRLTYKFYGAWWPRVAGWRCFSGFMWDYYSSKLKGKQYKQNTSPKSYKTEIKILANPGLA